MGQAPVPTQVDRGAEDSPAARGLLAAAALAAAIVLAGVYLCPAGWRWCWVAVRGLQVAAAAALVLDRAIRFRRARQKRLFARDRWMDLALVAAAGLAVGVGQARGGLVLPAAGMYILVWRAWVLIPRQRLLAVMNVLLTSAGAIAVTALVLEYGFRQPLPVRAGVLHAVQTVAVAVFILDRIVRLESARDRREYLRLNWVDFALMGAACAVLVVAQPLYGKVLSAGALYLIITQAYILIAVVLRAVNVNLDFAASGLHPTWLLIGSFAAMCLAGSGLLMLPVATPAQGGISYPDALFTATSATCVTGLVVLSDTGGDFTPFGQAVILALIQAGGLGIMIFGTVVALVVGRGLSARSRDTLGQMIGESRSGEIARVAKFVVGMTLAVELAGACLLLPMYLKALGGLRQAAWHSVFHSVSAFCNAGFALHRQNLAPLRDHWQIMGVIAPLIVLGGLGFPVLEDCGRYARRWAGRGLARRRGGQANAQALPPPRLMLHSKIVLTTTAALILAGAAGLLAFGFARTQAAPYSQAATGRGVLSRARDLPWPVQVREAMFQSITARTAGFNTCDMQDDLTDAGRLWMCWLMIVGGSPASTAGGMKTVTLAILVLTAWSVIRRRSEVEAFGRTIAHQVLRKVITLAALYLALVGAVTLGLLCVELSGRDFLRAFFEACSACGTVGLSTGITPKANSEVPAKLILIAGMFAGRVGPLTLLAALTTRLKHVRYAYPAEEVVIG